MFVLFGNFLWQMFKIVVFDICWLVLTWNARNVELFFFSFLKQFPIRPLKDRFHFKTLSLIYFFGHNFWYVGFNRNKNLFLFFLIKKVQEWCNNFKIHLELNLSLNFGVVVKLNHLTFKQPIALVKEIFFSTTKNQTPQGINIHKPENRLHLFKKYFASNE